VKFTSQDASIHTFTFLSYVIETDNIRSELSKLDGIHIVHDSQLAHRCNAVAYSITAPPERQLFYFQSASVSLKPGEVKIFWFRPDTLVENTSLVKLICSLKCHEVPTDLYQSVRPCHVAITLAALNNTGSILLKDLFQRKYV